jgi:uncharacterized protein (TIGR03000 family)
MATNGGALIELKVPADAAVTFDNQPTQQTGEIRQFITPPLELNKSFSYMVHVKAQNLDENRKINVSPDQRVTMDFTQPAGEQRAAPGQAPAPGRRSYGAQEPPGARLERPAAAPAPGRQPLGAREGAPAPLPQADRNAPQASGDTHEGTILSFSNGKLEMTDPQQGKHSHQLGPDAKIFIDGKEAKSEDLKANMKVTITTKKGDPQDVIRVDAQKGGNGAQPLNRPQPQAQPQPQP